MELQIHILTKVLFMYILLVILQYIIGNLCIYLVIFKNSIIVLAKQTIKGARFFKISSSQYRFNCQLQLHYLIAPVYGRNTERA